MMVDFHVEGVRSQEPLSATLFHEWVFPDGTPWIGFYRTESGYLLRFPELADFHVSRDGSTVRCWPAWGVPYESVHHLYLSQVLPRALSIHGKRIFHASAVEIGAEGVVFMGASRRGKSTLAASFATNGFRFLSDDRLVLESGDRECYIMPSHPSIRLWEDSHRAILSEGKRTAPLMHSKIRFFAGDDIVFCETPRRIRRVYFLGDGAQQELVFERINPAVALIELVKHSFLLDIEERGMIAAHFDELSGMVSRPIYYRLDYPRRFEELARVRHAIAEHVNTDESILADLNRQ